MLVWHGQDYRSLHDSRNSSLTCWYFSSRLPVSQLLVSWSSSRPVLSSDAWRAPKLPLVLGWGSGRVLYWCLWGFPLPPCLPLLYLKVLAVHPQSSPVRLFHVHGFLKQHIHGHRLLLFCGSGSGFMLAQSDPWRTISSFGQPAYLPTAHSIFPLPQFWGSVSRQYWPLFPWYLDICSFRELHSFLNLIK